MAIRYTLFVFRHKNDADERKRRSVACHRGDSFTGTEVHGQGRHSVGENGPTADNPDPLSAVASKNQVSLSLKTPCSYL